ncbi:endonuclease/exonuclease/phosphatase family protein [Vibrio sp. ZSDE26]|uniref:Endonuclease/exonuclease/phosphatase family protein n=1 Tax=Vibrio amylolyticus TaxID=2847292 RepID=A0A9X1XIR3_9VIBR|nr:endonuclease/exonuclease/phosphatase family protein [Vibrio amylolyticus]MCK6262608.1 endonuclease/exonuclease/phosphatase family protein [Vibrio amylolyticus]
MKQQYLLMLTLVLALVGTASTYSIFSVSDQPSVTKVDSTTSSTLQCHKESVTQAIDSDGGLEVLVWNIYKQNRPNWQQALNTLSSTSNLILLQEASMTESLKRWVLDKKWQGNQVEAFKAFDVSSGVLTLASYSPSIACAYLEVEPWLRLPKSALYSLYALSNGEELAVVNIHAVNFTYGVEEYRQQLKVLAEELDTHKGPIIFAGDFNSWNEERMAEMGLVIDRLALKTVHFSPDNRTEFINGLALDHLFYRGLTLETAEAPTSDASDHNPLIVRFML